MPLDALAFVVLLDIYWCDILVDWLVKVLGFCRLFRDCWFLSPFFSGSCMIALKKFKVADVSPIHVQKQRQKWYLMWI